MSTGNHTYIMYFFLCQDQVTFNLRFLAELTVFSHAILFITFPCLNQEVPR